MSSCRPSSLLLLGLAACGGPTFQTHPALAVVAVLPADGAREVPPTAVQAVCFSAPLLAADAVPGKVEVTDLSQAPVPGLTVALEADPRCVRLGHAPLLPQTGYLLQVGKGLRAADGAGPLSQGAVIHFQTGSP